MNDNPTAAWWSHIRETACSVQDLQSKLENIPASVWEYYENDHQAIEVNAEKEKWVCSLCRRVHSELSTYEKGPVYRPF